MKLCKDCRYQKWRWWERLFLAGQREKFAECFHPAILREVVFCGLERDPQYELINACGQAGKLWEPKPRRWWKFWKRP